MTARGNNDVGLADKIRDLFAGELRTKGLNLDGNYRKTGSLFDFLACVPKLLEAFLKKHYIRQSFMEVYVIDADTGMLPVFENIL